MTSIIAAVRRFLSDTEGASVVEYAVALLLIAGVTLAATAVLGDKLSAIISTVAQSI
jgi:Flp pilus assembly pilin Flp